MDDNLHTRSAEMRETPSPLPSPLPSSYPSPSPSPLEPAIPSPNPDQKPSTSTPSITSTTTPPPPPSTAATNSKRPRESSARPSIRRIQTNRASSASNSPAASRESSPVRPLLRTTSSARAGTPSRSRKNSSDISPSRSASAHNPPSAAAIQRLLSGQTIPPLNYVASDPSIKAPVPQKPLVTSEVRDGPRWPVSPRLRSPPPPRQNSILSPRRAEQDPLAINVQRTSPPADQPTEPKPIADSETEDTLLAPGMRTPARGVSGGSSTLETVQEISQPNTPALGLDGATDTSPNGVPGLATDNYSVEGSSHETLRARPSAVTNESGSDSGGKGEIRMKNTTPTTTRAMGPPKSFAASAIVGRGKPSGEGLARNMTVETETVSSIPQVAVGTGVGGLGNSGSLRAKQSTETIRPRKEKKKTRKAPSVTSGTASSKADIFEAKVASAVDEANSSDSEETFVYESNPPEAERPRRFHHSRTPSATSMASQIDARNGVRSMMDATHSVAMKKSMKFVNSYNSAAPEMSTEDDGKGTARSNVGIGRGTTHHHHFSRWGRNGGNGHPSLFDNESPFPNAAKSKFSNTSRQGSRPTSPRVLNARVAGVGNGKKTSPITANYDLDDAADDERTPLIPASVRSARSSRLRRTGAVSLRQMEHQRQERSVLGRFAGCLVLSFMVLLVISGAIGFMFATTQPLANVKVLALKNILASEQDVILDMQVIAQNPNLVAVTVESMDMVIFAKSKYAGTDSEWWARPPRTIGRRGAKIRRDDPINDPPIDHDPNTNPNLEIGHVYEFESPLIFEGSPFQHASSISLGEIRILKPGNQTEPRGSDRWGRVLQHEFELIVRGTLRYTLPLSSKARSVGIEGRATVKPNAADQDPDNVHIIDGFDRV